MKAIGLSSRTTTVQGRVSKLFGDRVTCTVRVTYSCTTTALSCTTTSTSTVKLTNKNGVLPARSARRAPRAREQRGRAGR